MTVAGDTRFLGTPEELRAQLRLDYKGTPFPQNDSSVYVLRYTAENPDAIEPSFNSAMGGTNPRLDQYTDPFTGNGFVQSGDEIIPEYTPNQAVEIGQGEIWEVLDSGTQRLVAVFDKGSGAWIPVRG
jgi:hypothetical protein